MASTRALPFGLVFFEWQLREFVPHLGFHRGTARLPFAQTTGHSPSLRFSARSLRATRPNARSARATNAGGFFASFALRFLFITRLAVEPNLFHQSPKSLIVGWQSAVVPNCPARRERQVIIQQTTEAAFGSPTNVRRWNIVSSHNNASAHTRDRLLHVRKPKIVEFQIVA